MKKLLALVLALVMTLGLATVGSNAALDFADADKISEEKLEAVTVVDAIGVMKGDETGFRPGDVLTRAEGAAILARLYGTPEFAAQLNGDGSKFSDVPANFWNGNGSGMIEYCAVNGLLAGVGNGKFDPNGKLTVVAFTKMMLNALGYSTELEGYYGADWSIKVMSRANAIYLLRGIEDAKPSDQITREQAAQLIFNTLKTAEVEYANKGTNLSVNGAEISIGATDAKPVTNERRDRQTIYDNVVNARENANGAFVVEFAEEHFPMLIRTDTMDIWGAPCTTWTYNRTELGTWERYDLLVKQWTTRLHGYDLYDAMGAIAYSDYAKAIYVDGVLKETQDFNGNIVDRDGDGFGDIAKMYNASSAWLSYSGRGTETYLYVKDGTTGTTNATAYVRVVVKNTYLAEVEADYNKSDKAVSLGIWEAFGTQLFRNAKSANCLEDLTGYKVGDMVKVQMVYPRTNSAIVLSVTPAKVNSDAYINKYVTDEGWQVFQVFSTAFKEGNLVIGAKCFWNDEILDSYGLETLKGWTYDVYEDDYGYMLGIDYHTTDTNYVFVVGTQISTTNLAYTSYKANVIWMDGTMETINFKLNGNANNDTKLALNNNGNVASQGNPTVNAWFTFSKDDAGNVTVNNIVPINLAHNDKTANRARQYATRVVNLANSADIGVNNPTLPALKAELTAAGAVQPTTAIGKDESVYITVATDGALGWNQQGAIKSVNAVSTGIKTTAIEVEQVNLLGNFATSTAARIQQNWPAVNAPDNANAFYLYNARGYILAAVVVGENAGVARNFVYVISGPEVREYNGRYLDTYTVIKNNKIDEIVVDSAKSGTTEATNKLGQCRLHEVVYDKDGIVIALKNTDLFGNWTPDGLHQRNAALLNTEQNIKEGYTYTLTNNNVTLEGNSMVINKNDQLNECYVLIDDKDCTYFVQNPDSWWVFDVYSNAKSALAAAQKQVSGKQSVIEAVTSITNGANGTAKTVIFDTAWNGQQVVPVVGSIVVVNTTPGNYVNAGFYHTAGAVIGYTDAMNALLAKMRADGVDGDIDVTTTIVGAVAVPTLNFTYKGVKQVQPVMDLAGYAVDQSYQLTYGTTVKYLHENDAIGTYAGKHVFQDDSYLAYLGVVAAATLMPDFDIVLFDAANANAAIQAALNAGNTVELVANTVFNDLDVPKGAALIVDEANLTVDNLTVEGSVLVGGNLFANKDVTVNGGILAVLAYEDENGNEVGGNLLVAAGYAVDAKKGADITVVNEISADELYVDCAVECGVLDVDDVFFPGAETNSTLTVADQVLEPVDVWFGYSAVGVTSKDSKGVMTLPTHGKSNVTNVYINGNGIVRNANAIEMAQGADENTVLVIENAKGVETNIGEIVSAKQFVLSTVGAAGGVTVDKVDGLTGKDNVQMDSKITAKDGSEVASDDDTTVNGKPATTAVYAYITGASFEKKTTDVYASAGDTITITFNAAITGKVTVAGPAGNQGWSVNGKTATITLSESMKSGGTLTISGVKLVEVGEDESDCTGNFTVSFDANVTHFDAVVDDGNVVIQDIPANG